MPSRTCEVCVGGARGIHVSPAAWLGGIWVWLDSSPWGSYKLTNCWSFPILDQTFGVNVRPYVMIFADFAGREQIFWKRGSWCHPKKLYMKVNPHSTAAKGLKYRVNFPKTIAGILDPSFLVAGAIGQGIIIPDGRRPFERSSARLGHHWHHGRSTQRCSKAS